MEQCKETDSPPERLLGRSTYFEPLKVSLILVFLRDSHRDWMS